MVMMMMMMNDDEKKRFSDFAENWLSCSLRLKMCAIFEFSDFAQKWLNKIPIQV